MTEVGGKAVYITGGSSGMGFAVGKKLAALGAHIAIFDRSAGGDALPQIEAARRAFDDTGWSADTELRVRGIRQLQQAMRDHAEELRELAIAADTLCYRSWTQLARQTAHGIARHMGLFRNREPDDVATHVDDRPDDDLSLSAEIGLGQARLEQGGEGVLTVLDGGFCGHAGYEDLPFEWSPRRSGPRHRTRTWVG